MDCHWQSMRRSERTVAFKTLLCLTTLTATIFPACAQESAVTIRCEMTIRKSLPRSAPAELTFTLTNASASTVQVLKWQTPFEGMRSAMFEIRRDGTEVDYRGPMLKRSAPQKDDYFTLKSGERRTTKIALADGWDIETPGNYTVEYTAELFDVAPENASVPRELDALSPLALQCNTVSFTRQR